jgi:peptidoglycan hydrolase-like protein with peptidoglycan-binding domain
MFLPSNITLQFGDSGDFVSEMQRRLALVRCLSESLVNGFFDGPTVNAVSLFQSQCGLRADGIAGPETLRRLNASVAGAPASSSNDKAAEEAQQLAAQNALLAQQAAQQQTQLQQGQWGISPTMHQPPATDYPPMVEVAPIAPAPPVTAYTPPQAFQQPLATAPLNPVMPSPMPMETAPLSAPLLQAQAPQATMDPATAAQPLATNPLLRPQPAMQQPPAAMHTAPPLQQPPAPQAAPLQAAPAPQAPQPLAKIEVAQIPAEPQQQPSLMQKAATMANAFIQKLANYFEAKLPPDTLREVQEVGKTMLKNGVKEAPIPTDPAARAPEQPARGQAQAQQRG